MLFPIWIICILVGINEWTTTQVLWRTRSLCVRIFAARQGITLTYSHEAGVAIPLPQWEDSSTPKWAPSGRPSFNIVQEYKKSPVMRHRNSQQCNEIAIIQTVGHNRHEDVALQRQVRNALTISGQRAYHSHPVALVSHQPTIRIRASHLFGSSRTSKRRNRYANVRYSSQYARLKDILISHH
jgi:hypothetical protein